MSGLVQQAILVGLLLVETVRLVVRVGRGLGAGRQTTLRVVEDPSRDVLREIGRCGKQRLYQQANSGRERPLWMVSVVRDHPDGDDPWAS